MTTKCLLLAGFLALAAAGSARAQQPTEGATIYAHTCAACHGARGTPAPAMAHAMGIPDLAAATVTAATDSTWREIVLDGKAKMPAYKARLTPAQVEAVVAYLRTLGKH
jgi:cytochrome c6